MAFVSNSLKSSISNVLKGESDTLVGGCYNLKTTTLPHNRLDPVILISTVLSTFSEDKTKTTVRTLQGNTLPCI